MRHNLQNDGPSIDKMPCHAHSISTMQVSSSGKVEGRDGVGQTESDPCRSNHISRRNPAGSAALIINNIVPDNLNI